MIQRTFEADYLSAVANHPEVRPWLGFQGAGELDFSAFVADPANYAILGEHGGWLLHAKGPGVYEIHSLFLPEGRGKPFFCGARDMLRWMFTATDCVEILTQCPDDNPAARMAALKNGFKEMFRREDCWNGVEGVCGVSYQHLTVDVWAMRDPECLRAGRAFHETLEAAKIAAGSESPVHPDDEAHDRAAGAAWLMANAGQVPKGILYYNRWASFAGYQPIGLGPPTIDVRDAIIRIDNGQTHVIAVR